MLIEALVSRRRHREPLLRHVLVLVSFSLVCQNALAVAASRSDSVPNLSRAVDDITPAVKNATAEAVADAEELLHKYSDVLVALMIPVGVVSSFFGYFLLGPVLFTAAFLIGGGICFVAVRAGVDEPRTSAWLSIVGMIVGGGLCGFLTTKMLAVGMFAVGATLGVTASAALKAILWSKVFPSSPNAGFIFGAVVLGIVGGILALSLRKKMLILSTAYAGSFAFFFGIGHFAGHFPNLESLNEVETGVFEPWAVMYLCLTALVGTAGMFVQLHMTREKPMPTESSYSRHRGHERLAESGSESPSDCGRDDAHVNEELLRGLHKSSSHHPAAFMIGESSSQSSENNTYKDFTESQSEPVVSAAPIGNTERDVILPVSRG